MSSKKELRTGSRIWSSEESLIQFLRERGIPKRYFSASLSDFPNLEIPDAKIESFYIQGDVGSGKTHLLCALMKENSFGTSSLFTTCDDLIQNIRDSISNKAYSSEEAINNSADVWITKYKEVDILALDDFFMEKVTEWSRSIIYSIINYRYNEVLRTYVSSNVALKDISLFDARISRRLTQMCEVLELKKIAFQNEATVYERKL